MPVIFLFVDEENGCCDGDGCDGVPSAKCGDVGENLREQGTTNCHEKMFDLVIE